MQAIKETNFKFDTMTRFTRGKVRDIYFFKDKIALVATDRISAFDVILPEAIPFKGMVLNKIASKMLEATKDIVPNWVFEVPDPNVTIGLKCEPYPVEMVIRGYLAGHAWREYRDGKRMLCGVQLPDGLQENDKLPEPIITPTTKADQGHDMDISREDIISKGIVAEQEYKELEKYTRALFEKGTEIASKQELILVDTKYEFGKASDKIYLIDEVHTPDSSRYFYKEGYDDRQQRGEKQKQLSKEFVREWLMSNGFQGKEDQKIPEMTSEVTKMISDRYLELYKKVTGEELDVTSVSENPENRIHKAIESTIYR